MSVNLSVKQLQHSDIAADVRDALAESGLAARSLTLEITETVLMTDTDLAVQRLEELKELGVRLAMDDFGTGYSSLSYLSRFPVDILKMDRSFLRDGASPKASGARGGGHRAGRDAAARGRRRGDRVPGAVARRCASSGAARARASCSPGRWTPTRRWSTCAPTRRTHRSPPQPMHHNYEGLDRSGGFSRVRLLAPLRLRDFRLLWSGMCVSLLGDGVFIVAHGVAGLRALEHADGARRGRDRHDRADDRLPAARRRHERPLRPPPGDARRGRGAGARDRRDRRPVAHRRARALAHARCSWPSSARATAFFGPAFDAIVPDVLPAVAAPAGELARPVRPADRPAARRPGDRRPAHRRLSGSAGRSRSTRRRSRVSAAALLAMAPPPRTSRTAGTARSAATSATASPTSASTCGCGGRSRAPRSPTCCSWARRRCCCRSWSRTTCMAAPPTLGWSSPPAASARSAAPRSWASAASRGATSPSCTSRGRSRRLRSPATGSPPPCGS